MSLPTGAEKRTAVKNMFDRIAPRYDLLNRLVSLGLDQSWRRLALDLVHVGPADLVLDLACGTGLVGRELHRRGYTCIDGLDLSQGMLTKAESLGIYRELMQEDLTRRTSIQDGVYPSLICVGSFASGHLGPEHLREMIRVVRPSAPIVIYMNAKPCRFQDYAPRYVGPGSFLGREYASAP